MTTNAPRVPPERDEKDRLVLRAPPTERLQIDQVAQAICPVVESSPVTWRDLDAAKMALGAAPDFEFVPLEFRGPFPVPGTPRWKSQKAPRPHGTDDNGQPVPFWPAEEG
jgi:hypothetical protein